MTIFVHDTEDSKKKRRKFTAQIAMGDDFLKKLATGLPGL